MQNKEFNTKLFKELESVESKLHERFGFSVDRQKLFSPLYSLCRVTPKQILEARINSLGLSDMVKEQMWKEVNDYTLHITDQAVGDEIKTFDALGKAYAKDILSRIKTLTEEQK